MIFAGAGLVFESGQHHDRILVGLVFMAVRGCCTWLVADIITNLSCLCYNLNGQKLSSNTPVVNTMTKCPQQFYLICLIWQLSSSTIQDFEAETQAELEVN